MKNIADMRKDYKARELDEASCLDDPVVQFQIWLDEAITADVDEPTAMLVSTVSPEGRPAARVVLLKGVENGRFVFLSKGEEDPNDGKSDSQKAGASRVDGFRVRLRVYGVRVHDLSLEFVRERFVCDAGRYPRCLEYFRSRIVG